MIGVEALLRWPQPDGRFIEPEEFVPVAEDSGLMNRVGAFVIDESCRQLKAWQDDGLQALRMCVNVSKCQLTSDDFVAAVERTLEKHDLRPEKLELELSERGVLSGNDDVLDILLHLKRLGVTLSIDDFGTGDAGIAYLKELPVDALKIDRSYVSGLADAGRDSAITSAMIALGHKLGMIVVAEGVETSEQLAILSSLGCDQYQGFYCSPAIFPEKISRVFQKG
jgi:EAL domain-containing protein (putative c-di-GMP-specific phosphodiesterase class I)